MEHHELQLSIDADLKAALLIKAKNALKTSQNEIKRRQQYIKTRHEEITKLEIVQQNIYAAYDKVSEDDLNTAMKELDTYRSVKTASSNYKRPGVTSVGAYELEGY